MYIMDITNVFKACVKTIRTRNKAFGLNTENEKSKIFHYPKQKTDFSKKSKEVLTQISRLRDFLLEHKKAYLNFSSYIPECPRMSDNERDKIDTGAQKIMTLCSQLIQEFKQESLKNECSLQLMEHQKAVYELLDNYLKVVCKIYSEQRAIRLKRTLENKNISKLKCESIKKDKLFTGEKTSNVNDYEEFSPEELQVFEAENVQLLEDITGYSEEVKKVEGAVVKIAQLQEIFTDKVLQQETEIERIAAAVIGSTENVKDANDQIRGAIQRNAGFRVWVLFFLLVLSFSLLFLDWYND